MGLLNDKEIPIGFGMALAQNVDAMQAFASLNDYERELVISRSRNAHSKEAMNNIINSLLR